MHESKFNQFSYGQSCEQALPRIRGGEEEGLAGMLTMV